MMHGDHPTTERKIARPRRYQSPSSHIETPSHVWAAVTGMIGGSGACTPPKTSFAAKGTRDLRMAKLRLPRAPARQTASFRVGKGSFRHPHYESGGPATRLDSPANRATAKSPARHSLSHTCTERTSGWQEALFAGRRSCGRADRQSRRRRCCSAQEPRERSASARRRTQPRTVLPLGCLHMVQPAACLLNW
jgi:hypothetical protein